LQQNSFTVTPTIWYCYDAYCGWCYGFSPVIKKLHENYKDRLAFDVLSGGMILSEQPAHIGVMAGYIEKAYKNVEELSGIQFGEDYLWHIRNPDQSDWHPDSLKPAIALCVFKHYYADRAVEWAADLQYALHYEGRDLTDDEAYRHLLEKYEIPAEEFYNKLHSEESKEQAQYEFQLVKQLQVTGYPCVLMQVGEGKFYLIARGFTPYEALEQNVLNVLFEIGN
jgi:putative protein-disulfide isomerase